MTDDEALAYYLPTRTDDLKADVCAALRSAALWRRDGPIATAHVVRVANQVLGMTYRAIQAASATDGTSIDHETARRLVSHHVPRTD